MVKVRMSSLCKGKVQGFMTAALCVNLLLNSQLNKPVIIHAQAMYKNGVYSLLPRQQRLECCLYLCYSGVA